MNPGLRAGVFFLVAVCYYVGMAKVQCLWDGTQLESDEAEFLAVEGEGKQAFCGEDCRNRYVLRKRNVNVHVPKTTPPKPDPIQAGLHSDTSGLELRIANLERQVAKLIVHAGFKPGEL